MWGTGNSKRRKIIRVGRWSFRRKRCGCYRAAASVDTSVDAAGRSACATKGDAVLHYGPAGGGRGGGVARVRGAGAAGGRRADSGAREGSDGARTRRAGAADFGAAQSAGGADSGEFTRGYRLGMRGARRSPAGQRASSVSAAGHYATGFSDRRIGAFRGRRARGGVRGCRLRGLRPGVLYRVESRLRRAARARPVGGGGARGFDPGAGAGRRHGGECGGGPGGGSGGGGGGFGVFVENSNWRGTFSG